MPPFLYKGLIKNDVVDMLFDDIWQCAKKCLQKAERVIFSGLSLRDTDIMLQLLLKENINEHAKIYLISPKSKGDPENKSEHKTYRQYKKYFNILEENYFTENFECNNWKKTPI